MGLSWEAIAGSAANHCGQNDAHRVKHGRLEMLFGTCNCLPVSHRLSRRNLLYAGGAGFVSTLVGTLAGTGRIARAQPLGSRVPEVDRLAVTIVTDTQIIKFIPTE